MATPRNLDDAIRELTGREPAVGYTVDATNREIVFTEEMRQAGRRPLIFDWSQVDPDSPVPVEFFDALPPPTDGAVIRYDPAWTGANLRASFVTASTVDARIAAFALLSTADQVAAITRRLDQIGQPGFVLTGTPQEQTAALAAIFHPARDPVRPAPTREHLSDWIQRAEARDPNALHIIVRGEDSVVVLPPAMRGEAGLRYLLGCPTSPSTVEAAPISASTWGSLALGRRIRVFVDHPDGSGALIEENMADCEIRLAQALAEPIRLSLPHAESTERTVRRLEREDRQRTIGRVTVDREAPTWATPLDTVVHAAGTDGKARCGARLGSVSEITTCRVCAALGE